MSVSVRGVSSVSSDNTGSSLSLQNVCGVQHVVIVFSCVSRCLLFILILLILLSVYVCVPMGLFTTDKDHVCASFCVYVCVCLCVT